MIFACIDQILVFVCGWRFIFFAIFRVFLHPILLVVMKRIKSKFPLADIFNFVLGKLSVLKSISEPVTFSSRDNALSALYEEAYKLADTSLDRMQIEAEEVNERYVKLAAFIDSGKMDEVVNDMYNKCLLEMQCCTMFDYIRLLDTRIQRMQGSDGAKVIKMNFGMAIMALKAGYPIRRKGWNGEGLMVFKQVPAHIESDVIPKMQSLPQSAKDLILKGKGFIDYTSQCLIYNENTGRADSWVPSISDVFADDWEIVV